MPYEQKPGQGALFKNDKKGNEKAPDYRGSANIDGTTFEVAGWIKKNEWKAPFLSLSVKRKEAKHTEQVYDDEVPF